MVTAIYPTSSCLTGQAEHYLTSSQHLLAKNEYVAAAEAIANAESLLLDLQQAEAGSQKTVDRKGGAWGGMAKENHPSATGDCLTNAVCARACVLV